MRPSESKTQRQNNEAWLTQSPLWQNVTPLDNTPCLTRCLQCSLTCPCKLQRKKCQAAVNVHINYSSSVTDTNLVFRKESWNMKLKLAGTLHSTFNTELFICSFVALVLIVCLSNLVGKLSRHSKSTWSSNQNHSWLKCSVIAVK